MPDSHNFIVGTFNTPHLYTLSFTPPSTLTILAKHNAVGSHSWLHLNESKTNLYATAWTEPPSVAAYKINDSAGKSVSQISLAHTATRSGYVTATKTALFSAGGPSGEVFSLDPESGAIIQPSSEKPDSNHPNGTNTSSKIQPLQTLSFIDAENKQNAGNAVLDFGGLRHGAHSTDLSPSEHALYVADIGRNCIWTYSVSPTNGTLTLGEKHISPRPDDGPRHVWPHPNGKVVYCLQEHTSIVDVFECDEAGVKLTWVQGRRIVPKEHGKELFWADEVRTSLSNGGSPKYLYASTRGLKEGVTPGWVAVYALDVNGLITSTGSETAEDSKDEHNQNGLLALWETPTSGGWANAVQPGPTVDGVEYLALTDSEKGYVMVLSWDGREIKEAARVRLEGGGDKVEGAATAVWLS
ncbi:Muconate cycloisomerase 1 [Cyphellophora attinorum]|uniref:Muconate cycloisomerase 1 n=1 Tax=Cyphellophora attinorum TaxID=1664694 RepID=A0A0N1HE74_9EURO|nr:Muconate cycloisomerase 1 [Phialophora attinorum]KPI43017.1 Muconate cycloisomerase 1 [Phialophora attinorum]